VPKSPPITAPSPIGASVWITAGYSACKHQLDTPDARSRSDCRPGARKWGYRRVTFTKHGCRSREVVGAPVGLAKRRRQPALDLFQPGEEIVGAGQRSRRIPRDKLRPHEPAQSSLADIPWTSRERDLNITAERCRCYAALDVKSGKAHPRWPQDGFFTESWNPGFGATIAAALPRLLIGTTTAASPQAQAVGGGVRERRAPAAHGQAMPRVQIRKPAKTLLR